MQRIRTFSNKYELANHQAHNEEVLLEVIASKPRVRANLRALILASTPTSELTPDVANHLEQPVELPASSIGLVGSGLWN